MSDEDDRFNNILCPAVRAKIAAARGDLDQARAFAEEAVAAAAGSDALTLRSDTLMDYAKVLGLMGNRDAQLAAVRQALDLYERKGNLVSTANARALLEELAAEPLAERD